MNAETGVPNAITGDEIIVGIREIHSVPLVMNGVAKNPVPLGFPEMDAIATRGRSHVGASGYCVPLDDSFAGAAKINAEGVHFDTTIPDRCARRRSEEHTSELQSRQ